MKKIIIFGATGLVGSEVLREAIKDSQVEKVLAIVRKPLTLMENETVLSSYLHKLKVIIHSDFLDYEKIKDQFKEYDTCVWALGISQSQVSKEDYIKITQDYTIAAATMITQINPHMTFIFVSGMGADQQGNGRLLFGKIKGATEKELTKLGFYNLLIVRPAGIRPIHKNLNAPLIYKLINPFYPLFELVLPSHVIKSTDLARAILTIIHTSEKNRIIENQELRKIANPGGK